MSGNDYLIVVDMQNDFVDGSLGTPEAQAMRERAEARAAAFDGRVVFTMDTHGANYAETQEGKLLPVEHCIEGTPGWQLTPGMEAVRRKRDARVYEKPTFASVDLARDLAAEHERAPITSIELIGLCTDICVVSNALTIKGFLPDVPLRVRADCCAATTPEAHESALATMRSCQIEVD